jgi:putative DNA-invertase from lambdoid prophage Rac
MVSEPRIGIYLRVSTQDQNTELQASELRRFAEARGWNRIKVYEDKATGTNGNRPMLQQMLQDARRREIDVVVCWKLDRLFRSLKDLVVTLQELSELGIEFVSLKDSIDLTTSSGRLMMHMIGAFAEFEASLIKERVRAGLANAKRKGQKLGRPSRLDSTLILELRQQGLSLSTIAEQVGATKSAVSKTLKKHAPELPETAGALTGKKAG